jgi:hypothetical protein
MERMSEVAEKDYERGVLPRWKCVNCPGAFCMTCGGLGSYMSETPLKAGDVLFSETTTETLTRTVHRQVTVDGEKIDLRSGVAYSMLVADINDLGAICDVWVKHVYQHPDPRVRRSCQLRLQKALLMRGKEMPADLKNEIIQAAQVLVTSHKKSGNISVCEEKPT